MGRKALDLSEVRFGFLTAKYIYKRGCCGKAVLWLCLCDCGKETVVASSSLTQGHTKSCGHLVSEKAFETHKKYNKYDLTRDYGLGYTENGYTFLFDLNDYNKIKHFCWNYDSGYIVSQDENRRKIRLHRLVLDARDGDTVDHVERNTLDYRKENLRLATKQQNTWNRRITNRNKTGIIGVSCSENNTWRVSIQSKILGKRYTEFNDAVIKRLQLEKEIFGTEFAPQRHLFEEYGI